MRSNGGLDSRAWQVKCRGMGRECVVCAGIVMGMLVVMVSVVAVCELAPLMVIGGWR